MKKRRDCANWTAFQGLMNMAVKIQVVWQEGKPRKPA